MSSSHVDSIWSKDPHKGTQKKKYAAKKKKKPKKKTDIEAHVYSLIREWWPDPVGIEHVPLIKMNKGDVSFVDICQYREWLVIKKKTMETTNIINIPRSWCNPCLKM